MNIPSHRIKFLRVALDAPRLTYRSDLLDYCWPSTWPAQVGQRVLVPFGRQTLLGLIVEISDISEVDPGKLRDAIAVLDDLPPLPPDWFALMRFAADYYQRSLGEVALPALPLLLRKATAYQPQPVQPEETPRYGSRSIRQLRKKSVGATKLGPSVASVENPILTSEQTVAVTEIRSALQAGSGFQPLLLHGVTGSGKTEVYLQALAEVLARGQQALVLVPEINLTPQLLDIFRGRFPQARLASLHSGMPDGERARQWLSVHEGEADILLGTRMAVMVPLPHLGLIVVDEEHDPSFKQQEGLRYSARDLALVLAQQRRIPIILGSATPSLETWAQAERGRYKKLVLTSRAADTAGLPQIRLVSLERTPLEHGFSATLRAAIQQRLERGEQSLIFHNRRGYAPVLACGACGWISDCRRCSAHAVFHKQDGRLHCHHCGWEARVPKACPDCGNVDLAPLGRGTQRIEEALADWFPDARVLRIDRDSTRRKGSMQTALSAVHAGEVDILVGTQMVAKGHDFRHLTLVGVVDADAALFSHDFRAAERLFANLMQVAGRAGRAQKPGEVLIQTRYPQHPLFAALTAHDFNRFAQSQLDERRTAGLPPYAYHAVLRAEAKTLEAALAFLQTARELAQNLVNASDNASAIDLYDPVPMNLVRVANVERAQLLIEARSRPALQSLLPEWLTELRTIKTRVQWHTEVDPLEI